jgi:hypothetical protein
MNPEVERALPRESEKPVSSLVQGSAKRNMPIAHLTRRIHRQPPTGVAFRLEGDLLDRNGEPSDQPRNLVQFVSTAILDRLRKPDEAFVIAHRGHVARNDRRRWLHVIKPEVWHRVTSAKSIVGSVVGECVLLTFSSRHSRSPDRALTRRIVRFIQSKRTPNRCSTRVLQAEPTPCQIGPFPALQGTEALLYAARGERLFRLFLGSSAVEHSTVNRMVAGSNPARGANKIKDFPEKSIVQLTSFLSRERKFRDDHDPGESSGRIRRPGAGDQVSCCKAVE